MNGYYGYNPFIYSTANNEVGLLYDLLNADVYQVPVHFVNIFDVKSYTNYDMLMKKCTQLGIGLDKLRLFLREGMENGLILKFPRSYWRNEIKTSIEAGFQSEENRIPSEFFNVWLQPTGKCNLDCSFCNSHVNCVCKCDTQEDQWSPIQLKNLLEDLWRYKGMLLKVSIHGGNPLLYPHLELLLDGLVKLKPMSIRLVIPNRYGSESRKKRLYSLLRKYGSNIKISYNLFPNYWDTNGLIDSLLSESEVSLLYDSALKTDNHADLLKKEGFRVKKNYLLKADLSNIKWYKERINEDFFEALNYHEFFFRKHLHKCWGCSFAIDSKGRVKPCLWSDQVLATWKNGKISQVFMDDTEVSTFYRENNLEKIEGCKDCIYRYGCKDCRVISEYLTKKRKTKNPLCNH